MIRRISSYAIRIAMVFVVVLLQSCGEQELTPIPANGTILAFGDSLTVGVGVDRQNSYPSVLAELTGRQVTSAGVSGEETTGGLARLPNVLEQARPSLIILLEGGNDILRNRSAGRIKQNLAAMIEVAQRSGVEVLLIGVPAKNLFSDTASLYRELADQYQLVFEDELIADLLRDRSYKSDSIHFNEKGYRLMAESIHELLVDHGAL
jgi:acyl-CoA thioesterase I